MGKEVEKCKAKMWIGGEYVDAESENRSWRGQCQINKKLCKGKGYHG